MALANFQSFLYGKNLFKDRDDAKRKLMEILPIAKMQQEDWIIIAVSTGGLYLTNKISKSLPYSTLELLFTEPITAPNNKETVIAMVSESEEIAMDTQLVESFDINLDYIYGEASRRYEEDILQYIYKYRKGETITSLENKNVLLIDEGIDSGLTMIASIKTAISMKAKTIAIVSPVMPLSLVPLFESLADEVYTLYKIANFVDTKFYYEELKDMNFQEIEEILKNNLKFRKDINELQYRIQCK